MSQLMKVGDKVRHRSAYLDRYKGVGTITEDRGRSKLTGHRMVLVNWRLWGPIIAFTCDLRRI